MPISSCDVHYNLAFQHTTRAERELDEQLGSQDLRTTTRGHTTFPSSRVHHERLLGGLYCHEPIVVSVDPGVWSIHIKAQTGTLVRSVEERNSLTKPAKMPPRDPPILARGHYQCPHLRLDRLHHANALGHTTSLRLLILRAQTPEPNRANAQRPRELSELQSAVPTSPTITPIRTAPLPLGSIAMPGSAALPHAQALASGEDEEEEDFGTVASDSRRRKSEVTTPQSAPPNTNANTNSSPVPRRASISPKRSRSLAVNVESDTPVAGPPHSTTTFYVYETYLLPPSWLYIHSRVYIDDHTSKTQIHTPAPVSLPTKRKRGRPFKVHVDESVVEFVPGAKRKGREVEEVLGSPMRVDAGVRVDAVCVPILMAEVRVEAEEADAIPVSPAKEVVSIYHRGCETGVAIAGRCDTSTFTRTFVISSTLTSGRVRDTYTYTPVPAASTAHRDTLPSPIVAHPQSQGYSASGVLPRGSTSTARVTGAATAHAAAAAAPTAGAAVPPYAG
ncbi:hypothetical protein DXG01_006741 [Tephrocybe rancida]|nr:hypothetical protein DXG01_006741 [Tephrocybe rancida]